MICCSTQKWNKQEKFARELWHIFKYLSLSQQGHTRLGIAQSLKLLHFLGPEIRLEELHRAFLPGLLSYFMRAYIFGQGFRYLHLNYSVSSMSCFRLEECNERVNSKTKTTETCMEEVIDFYHCVDHCAGPKIFAKLKWTILELVSSRKKSCFSLALGHEMECVK